MAQVGAGLEVQVRHESGRWDWAGNGGDGWRPGIWNQSRRSCAAPDKRLLSLNLSFLLCRMGVRIRL